MNALSHWRIETATASSEHFPNATPFEGNSPFFDNQTFWESLQEQPQGDTFISLHRFSLVRGIFYIILAFNLYTVFVALFLLILTLSVLYYILNYYITYNFWLQQYDSFNLVQYLPIFDWGECPEDPFSERFCKIPKIKSLSEWLLEISIILVQR